MFKARLSRRIVLWVFASIVAIEAIILIPSVYRRQQELLTHLKHISAAKASGIFGLSSAAGEPPDIRLLSRFEQTGDEHMILGGTLYTIEGQLVGSFGELPQLTYTDVIEGRTDFLSRTGDRYDAPWDMPLLDGQYALIIRHDSSSVRQELYAFIGRIAGLVLIISAFVTVATMIVLEPTLITPILSLRRDLLWAGEAISHDDPPPNFHSAAFWRNDELGEVISAFDQMYRQVSEAIAERKQAETALRLSEEKFSKAFRSSPHPITISTISDGRLIEVNDSFLKLFGYTVEEAIGHTVYDLNLWLNWSDRDAMIEALKRGKLFRDHEYVFRTKTGDFKTVLYSAELIWIGDQDCLLTVINDITERKCAEEALRESEMRFRSLVENAADAFMVIDADGHIIDANQQACDNLGYSRDELLALSINDIETKFDAEQIDAMRRNFPVGQSITLEGLHRRKDGTIFPVEARIRMLEEGGKLRELALVRDITERKQAEKALQQLAEIGELAAMIVHEVRNPLTTVLMGLNSFRAMDLPTRAQARLELALEESDRLQRLLNEILLYAKRQTLQWMELELNLFCSEMLESLQTMPAACDRTIHFAGTSGSVRILGDRDKLKQVFINLISNACEAVPAGEVVTWTIAPDPTNHSVYIRVHNGGDPIPPDLLPKLTQPFQTTKPSGNGLGLAIARRIVEAHGGELLITSSAQDGTIVSVRLPLPVLPA